MTIDQDADDVITLVSHFVSTKGHLTKPYGSIVSCLTSGEWFRTSLKPPVFLTQRMKIA